MSKTLFRINDIAISHKQYSPSINNYCRILGIVDENEVTHTEYEVITGCGDENSKVKILVEIIAEEDDDLNIIDHNLPFKVSRVNPHELYIRNPYKMIENTFSRIDRLNKRIDFFNRYKNPIDIRDEKLSKLIK